MKPRNFELAKELSKHSTYKYQLGAVVVKGNRILSTGFNTMRTSPRSTHPYSTLHAEMSAILKARCDITGSDLYVYRQTKDGCLASSKPCPYCMKLIKSAGIKNIYYTDESGYKKL